MRKKKVEKGGNRMRKEKSVGKKALTKEIMVPYELPESFENVEPERKELLEIDIGVMKKGLADVKKYIKKCDLFSTLMRLYDLGEYKGMLMADIRNIRSDGTITEEQSVELNDIFYKLYGEGEKLIWGLCYLLQIWKEVVE